MKRFLVALLGLWASWVMAEVDTSNPYTMMNQVAEEAFARLEADQEKITSNPEYLREVVKEHFLPYVNARYAAYKVLGPQLRQTSDEAKEVFVEAFTEYMVASYAQVLTQYDGQQVKIEQPKPIPEGRNILTVRVEIIDPKRPVIRIDFAMRQNRKTGQWLGFDMTAEGVSLLNTMQNEWGAKLRADGAEVVAEELRRLAAKPIVKQAEEAQNG
nr:phospholipid-binding protein MlaC [Thaumasiovibrio subtropicus]